MLRNGPSFDLLRGACAQATAGTSPRVYTLSPLLIQVLCPLVLVINYVHAWGHTLDGVEWAVNLNSGPHECSCCPPCLPMNPSCFSTCRPLKKWSLRSSVHQHCKSMVSSVLVSRHLMFVQIYSPYWSLIHCLHMAGGKHTPTLALCKMLLLPLGLLEPLLVQQNGTGMNWDSCTLGTETD